MRCARAVGIHSAGLCAGSPVGSPVGGVAKPDSNLVFAIVSSVISFFLTGIVLVGLGIYAIVCASKVDNLWYNGRIDEAYEQAAKAHKWAKWCLIGNGIFIGVILLVIIGGSIALGSAYGSFLGTMLSKLY